MKTHRIVFWSTLFIFIIGLLVIIFFNIENNTKNIIISVICSSLVASIVELPTLLSYKKNINDNIYFGLLQSKSFLLQFNKNIEERLKEKVFPYRNYGIYFINNISNSLNIYINTDNTLFVSKSKKNIHINSKKELYNLYNNILQNNLQIDIIRIQIELKEKHIEDLHNQLNILLKSNNELISKIDFLSNNILDKEALTSYNDNSKSIINILNSI